ncbi:MAG: twin-arginine translocase TatA/TatE family subunit [Bacteroidales bacterium]|nr:twin-arginine translocase TatA/TatE family subunit [Bacteroidales bacterium]MCR5243510.1 twin-arginine translocase TatA/TatE family subunit [Bacteroidales bacterium]MDT3356909.1 twin-arginine translocase TatA/TatE family subunit [Bacteroidota bacterium]
MIAYPLFIGYGEIILIIILFLLIFGAKKIPELMRGVGKGVRSFKEGLNDVEKEIKKEDNPSEKEDK